MGSLIKSPKAPTAPKPVELPEYKPPPEPDPVPEMPTPDEEAIRKKKKKEQQEQSNKSGRASTFLTEDNEGLG